MPKTPDLDFDFDDYGKTFFARYLHQLRVTISEQSDTVFEQAGIEIPSHCASLMVLLDDAGEAPVMKIADALGYSHQLVNQRLALLEKHRCARRYRDPDDLRRSLIKLTSHGRTEAAKVRKALPIIDAGIADMMKELGGDLQRTVKDARKALTDKPLSQRGRQKPTSRKPASRKPGKKP